MTRLLHPADSVTPSANRFAWVVAGERSGPDPVFDIDIGSYDFAAVIPTRGALLPEWLMLVPRIPCLAIRELDAPARRLLIEYAHEVSEWVAAAANHAVIFEHGAERVGSAVGCGVDQAHLHVVGIDGGFADWVVRNSEGVIWDEANARDPWGGIGSASDYMVLIDGLRAWKALIHIPTSQFLRRKVATFLGRPEEWDYRRHPNVENAKRTTAIFRRGDGRAARSSTTG